MNKLIFFRYVINKEHGAVNSNNRGTKTAAHYVLEVPAGGEATVKLRICDDSSPHLAGILKGYGFDISFNYPYFLYRSIWS